MSRFCDVTTLSPAEDDNTEESEEEDDGDSDGGEDEKVTVGVANIVQHFDDQVSCQVSRGPGRSKGWLEVTLTPFLTEVRRYLGRGGGGALRRLCH